MKLRNVNVDRVVEYIGPIYLAGNEWRRYEHAAQSLTRSRIASILFCELQKRSQTIWHCARQTQSRGLLM